MNFLEEAVEMVSKMGIAKFPRKQSQLQSMQDVAWLWVGKSQGSSCSTDRDAHHRPLPGWHLQNCRTGWGGGLWSLTYPCANTNELFLVLLINED